MRKKTILLLLFLCFYPLLSNAQDKKVLDHSVYDSWKKLENPVISPDGKWISYEINPQKGDGCLYIKNSEGVLLDSVPRGYKSIFSTNANYIVLQIKPSENTLRELKLKKRKKEQFPLDSLMILTLLSDKKNLYKFANLSSYKLPPSNSNWIGILTDKKDSLGYTDTTGTHKLILFNPVDEVKFTFEDVTEFLFDSQGKKSIFIEQKKHKGKIDTSRIFLFDTEAGKFNMIYQTPGEVKKISVDKQNQKIAFLHTQDTTKNKRYRIYLITDTTSPPSLIVDTNLSNITLNFEISTNDSLFFSNDGTKLFFPLSIKSRVQSNDTLLDEEKFKVDIWNWQDSKLITQQLNELDREKKYSYFSLYDLNTQETYQLADTLVKTIQFPSETNNEIALGIATAPYERLYSWEEANYADYYLINLNTKTKTKILTKEKFEASISPSGKYVVWYDSKDQQWKCFNIKTQQSLSLTSQIDVRFYNEEFDMPNDPPPYGLAGWSRNDEFVFIYDRYDIWKINPDNPLDFEKITHNGREEKNIFRYAKIEKDINFIPDTILLKVQNEDSLFEGFYSVILSNSKSLNRLVFEDYGYTLPKKAKDTNIIIWNKYSYTEYPDLWISNLKFTNPLKLSETNPQQTQYYWGTIEQYKWKDFKGIERKGLLLKPDNFDLNKKYPMIVYFYEKYTDRIHTHYIPSPSRSVINFPLYNSNGYVIFIPDITYEIGYPGNSALNIVVSGTQSLIDLGFVDPYRIGLQGQSWGGYQVAYIVTQTNLFKAAMAGAPVVNMTSAYGGIRWESGLVRQFQYEQSQSRIGATLWERLDLYIENSSLFHLDKVETPLLIMANDKDGAVPWQQGIELFTALRRLNKPAWMLTYNGDEHNLSKWPNRVDLSIRMKQFFDHFLKGTPEPEWLKYGIKAIDKGTKTGYELVQ
ncbi:MAG: alpha/beta hydrolase family protein [Ignavibacteria bacterium]